MRIVGALYLPLFVGAAFTGGPIKGEGPAGLLDHAAAGDATARFVVDTWVTFGVYVGVVGGALLLASRAPGQARVLVRTVIALEVGGIAVDVYEIARGYDLKAPGTWLAIHAVIIASGVVALRR